jgi:hypothetical protein
MMHAQPESSASPINPKYNTAAKPHTYQGNLWHLHPAIVKRLVALPNWVNWRWELNKEGDAWTKVPYKPRNLKYKASTNDRWTWATHTEAVANVEAGKADGIGFVLVETNICAFDIDNCLNIATGAVNPTALALIERCGETYVEKTVSGTGLRIIGLGGTKYVNRKQEIKDSKVSIESYRYCSRYITISGLAFDTVKPNMPDLGNIDAVLTEVVDELDRASSNGSGNGSSSGQRDDPGPGGATGKGARGADFFRKASLPSALQDLIHNGVPVGDRSQQFYHAVRWLKNLGWSAGDIVALLSAYPNGIASKYAAGNRIEVRVLRAYSKPERPKPGKGSKPDDATGQAGAAGSAGATGPANARLILSSEQFTRGFVPPDYLWDGILLRGFVYSFTARTGDGKTAVMLTLAAAVARGQDLSDREVAKGKVLYFAGENPDDIRMRWIAMAQHLNFDADTIDVHFIPCTFDIPKLEQRIREEVAAIDGVVLVIVDTSPAYFHGENENDNVEMIAHAEMLRRLKDLPGNPTVIAACHPVKGAANDNLIPRGGGAFLNAMDGNLCAHKTDMLVTMHHQGKFRGVDFEPMAFELESVTARKLLDTKGRHIPTVIARGLSKDDQRQKASDLRDEEDNILLLLFGREDPVSFTDIADGLHWYTAKSLPNKSKVQRLMKNLTSGGANKLIEVNRDGALLTSKGTAAATKVRHNRDKAGTTCAS